MSLPQYMGRYRGQPIEWTVGEEGDNKIPTWICRFALTEYLNSTEWEPVDAGLEITAYVYLFQRDGQPNQFGIKSLKDSIGWDGRSLASLANSDWSKTEVQLTIDEEEYKGKKKVKVQFINPRDWTGGIKKADPQQIVSLDQRYGSMLRALATQSGNGNGAAKPATTSAPAATPANPRRDAWKVFQDQNPGKDADTMASLWRTAIALEFGEKPQAQIANDDWVEFAKRLRQPKPVAAGRQEMDFDPPTDGSDSDVAPF